jgi:hypothetical protein
MNVYPAPGSKIGGEFPGFGCIRYLSQILPSLGFQAVYIAEGTQGASLAVFNPQQNVQIIQDPK